MPRISSPLTSTQRPSFPSASRRGLSCRKVFHSCSLTLPGWASGNAIGSRVVGISLIGDPPLNADCIIHLVFPLCVLFRQLIRAPCNTVAGLIRWLLFPMRNRDSERNGPDARTVRDLSRQPRSVVAVAAEGEAPQSEAASGTAARSAGRAVERLRNPAEPRGRRTVLRASAAAHHERRPRQDAAR